MSAPSPPQIKSQPLSRSNILFFYWNAPAQPNGTIQSYTITCIYASNGSIPSPNFIIINTGLKSSGNTAPFTNLTNNVDYTFQITATNENGTSTPATFRTFRPGFGKPNPPSTASASYTSSDCDKAIVSWTPPAVLPSVDIQWYPIKSRSSNNSDPILSATANALTQSSYLMQGLNQNSLYNFDVYSVNCPGWSTPLSTNTLYPYGKQRWTMRITDDAGYANSGNVLSITSDAQGNIYIGGFYATRTNAPGRGLQIPYLVTSSPTPSIWGYIPHIYAANTTDSFCPYLIKYNSAGIPQWATAITSTGSQALFTTALVSAIAVDASNNVYMCASLRTNTSGASIRFLNYQSGGGLVNGSPTDVVLQNSGTITSFANTEVYYIKYNSSGQILWISRFENNLSNDLSLQGFKLSFDSSGNIINGVRTTTPSNVAPNIFFRGNVVGANSPPLSGALTFNQNWRDVSNLNFPTAGQTMNYGYLYKINKDNGAFMWVAKSRMNIAGTIACAPVDASIDSNNNIYAYFSYRSNLNQNRFYNGIVADVNGDLIFQEIPATYSFLSVNIRNDTTYLALFKYDTNGLIQWGTVIVNPATVTTTIFSTTNYISIDSSNNLNITVRTFAAGAYSFRSYSSRDPLTGAITTSANDTVTITNTSGVGAIARYDTNGNFIASFFIGFGIVPKLLINDQNNNLYCIAEIPATVASNYNELTNYPQPPATSVTQQLFTSFTATSSIQSGIIAYNSNLQGIWAVELDSISSNVPTALAKDATTNDIFVGGFFSASTGQNLIMNSFNNVGTDVNKTLSLTPTYSLPSVTTATLRQQGYFTKYKI
jgi:hypothetical protein